VIGGGKARIVGAWKKRDENQGDRSIVPGSDRSEILELIAGQVEQVSAALHAGFTGVYSLRPGEAGGEARIEVGQISKIIAHFQKPVP